jgi:hypothetical protein
MVTGAVIIIAVIVDFHRTRRAEQKGRSGKSPAMESHSNHFFCSTTFGHASLVASFVRSEKRRAEKKHLGSYFPRAQRRKNTQ